MQVPYPKKSGGTVNDPLLRLYIRSLTSYKGSLRHILDMVYYLICNLQVLIYECGVKVQIWYPCILFARKLSQFHFSCFIILSFRLRLVRVKVFPKNRYFPEMLFSGKENVFMCLVAFQKKFRKIFSDVWLYS